MSDSMVDREKQQFIDAHYALVDALQNLPDMAPTKALWLLSEAAFYGKPAADFTQLGLAEQKRLGIEAVPLKAEYERAAGLWAVIRNALREYAREQPPA